MAKTAPVRESGILITCSKKPTVSISVPGKLKRRAEDLLQKAKFGSGEFFIVLEAHYPEVPADHPWVKVTQDPGSTMSYRLLIRIEKEAFDCKLRLPMRQSNPEAAARLTRAADYFCKNGWFVEKVAPPSNPLDVAWAKPTMNQTVPAIEATSPEEAHAEVEPPSWKDQALAHIETNNRKLSELEAELAKRIADINARAKEQTKLLRQTHSAAAKALLQENQTLTEALEQLFPTKADPAE